MTARARKAIGGLGIVAFLFVYAALVSWAGDVVPQAWWAQLVFYAIAGTAWGAPILPLIAWMNQGGPRDNGADRR